VGELEGVTASGLQLRDKSGVMKKNIIKVIYRYLKKLKYRFEEWKIGVGYFPVYLGSKR